MSIPLYQVDAFTNQPFAGNSATVCLLEEARETTWMQQVATENNLFEWKEIGRCSAAKHVPS